MRTPAILGALAIAVAGPIASAEIVYFENPAPGQPGHYDWYAPVGIARYLDVTLSAADQENTENGSSIGQAISGIPTGGTFGVMIGTAAGPGALFTSTFAVVPNELYVLALGLGDPLNGLDYEAYGSYTPGLPAPPGSWFPEGERRYVGVRTDDGNFGWIEVERTGLSLSAFSWAYETVPGAPMLAGVVPSPCTLALLAAAGLGRRPRR